MRHLLATALLFFIPRIVFSQEALYHDTQGKLEVSGSGQLTYTLPIALPPSIQSVGPTINLQYTSGQSGGIAGQGWNISSISSITRIGSRLDIDGFIDGVDFDDNDKLAFDGQRLLIKSGTYWADGSIYETEIQSNIKIELKGSGSNIYFIVTTPDGSRSWYGNFNGANASDLTAYYITRFEDADGNFIIYSYNQNSPNNGLVTSSNSITIDEIAFSANTNSNPTPLNKIKFTYGLVGRFEKAFIKGETIRKIDLLKKIEVYTNNLLFRKYQITHFQDDYGYDRVRQIQEFNGNLEPANPVIFNYGITLGGITNLDDDNHSFTDGIDMNGGIKLSGDFNGDNRMDIAFSNALYIKRKNDSGYETHVLPFLVSSRKTMAGSVILDNKVMQQQALLHISENSNNLNLKVWGVLPTGSVIHTFSYDKSIAFDNSTPIYDSSFNEVIELPYNEHAGSPIACNDPTTKTSNEYYEGDFNGDGISEVLAYKTVNERYYHRVTAYMYGQTVMVAKCQIAYVNDGVDCFLIDSNPNSSNILGEKGYLQLLNSDMLNGLRKYVNDFNGDGKSDILIVNTDGNYKIVSFKQLTAAPWVELELLGQGNLGAYDIFKQIQFGDYNGDSKIDIMLPAVTGDGCENNPGCNLWYIYYGQPQNAGGFMFSAAQAHAITDYMPKLIYPSTRTLTNLYYSVDVNKDGKTDLVRFEIHYQAGGSSVTESWRLFTFINNIGNLGPNANYTFKFDYVTAPMQSFVNGTIPFFGSSRNKKGDSDFIVLRHKPDYTEPGYFYKFIGNFKFDESFLVDNSLFKVTQSGGAIVDQVAYDSVATNGTFSGNGGVSDFYSVSNILNYPLSELRSLPLMKVVSRIKNTSFRLGVRYQDFKYNGLVVSFNGLGVTGFKKTARSNWYKTNSDKQIWNVTESDPLLRGALTRNYSILVNGGEAFHFEIMPVTQYYSGLINLSQNFYQPAIIDPTSKRYALLLERQKSSDFLTGVKNEKSYQYSQDGYFLTEKVVSKNYYETNLQGTYTTETIYNPPNLTGTGSSYHIGRPSEIITTSSAYGDTKATSEKMDYYNGRVRRIEKNPIGDPVTLVEEMTYYSNGNLQSKTTSAIGTSTANQVSERKALYTYDSSNRFIKTFNTNVTPIDQIGDLKTFENYHPLYGTPRKTINNTLNTFVQSTFDNWGKQISTSDNLDNFKAFEYARIDNVFKTYQQSNDGSSSYTEVDLYGNEIRKGIKNINNTWNIIGHSVYDYLNRKVLEYDPYIGDIGETRFTTFAYDDYSRLIQTTSPAEKTTNINYSFGTPEITTDDGIISKTTTKNSNGHLIYSSDAIGGNINYTYDANGNLLQSDYSSSSIIISYDSWNRKKTMTDPSAGTYSYEYNAYGEILKEETPKGITDYTLDATGKILTKHIVGRTSAENTDILSTYNYDPVYKWVTEIDVVNLYDGNSTYTYEYDTNGSNPSMQLKKTTELTPQATFTKEFIFYGSGKVQKETSTAKAHNKTSTKTIFNEYKYGYLHRIRDTDENGIVLWQTNIENARGQLISASLGNGINLANRFDKYGLPEQINLERSSNSQNLLKLETAFDSQRNNLLFRSNSMFDIHEGFQYDNLDRLEAWENRNFSFIQNCTFDSGLNGFTTNGGILVNSDGKLKASIDSENYEVTKLITTTASPGNILNIYFDETELDENCFPPSTPFSCNNSKLWVEIYEKDPNGTDIGGSSSILVFSGSTNEVNYQVSMYSNVYAKYYIKKDNSSPYAAYSPRLVFTLDNFKVGVTTYNYQSYTQEGKIDTNELGTYNYTDGSKPYQNTTIKPLTQQGLVYYGSSNTQSITYNAFKEPIDINQSSERISFGYNCLEQRSVMYYGSNNSNKLLRPLRKYYSGDGSMEIKYTLATDQVEFIIYAGGDAYSAPIVIKGDGSTTNNYYLHRDYLGSIMAISNSAGEFVEKRHFDAWGNLVKVQDGLGNNLPKMMFFDRGFTGHEHLQGVALIHMNARLYDPKLHRLLQPDILISDPKSTQDYNRYAYAHNNPLKYVDPDGNEAITIAVGVVVAVASYLITTHSNHQQVTAGGLIQSVVWGLFSSVISFGVGEVTATIGCFAAKAAVQGVLHGATQGGIQSLQGGNFWNGFASGSISSLAASAWSGGGEGSNYNGIGRFAHSGVGMIAFGSVMGGVGARLSGGNFWQGAATGFFVSAFNHGVHPNQKKSLLQRFKKINGTYVVDPYANADFSDAGIDKLNKNVDGLEAAYIKGNKPKFLFTLKDDLAETENGIINLNPNEIRTNYRLASVLFHEYRHAWQQIRISGTSIRDILYQRYSPLMAHTIEEWDAYNFETKMGGDIPETVSNFRKYSNILKYIWK